MDFKPSQKHLQTLKESTDVVSVIEGVIEAEKGAIQQYNKIIKLCEGKDYVTQDQCRDTTNWYLCKLILLFIFFSEPFEFDKVRFFHSQ